MNYLYAYISLLGKKLAHTRNITLIKIIPTKKKKKNLIKITISQLFNTKKYMHIITPKSFGHLQK